MTVNNTCETDCVDAGKVLHIQEELKQVNMEETAQLFKIMAEENRLKIIFALLHAEELCVCDLAIVAGMTTANASHHLRNLHAQNFVEYRKEGRLSFYSLSDDRVKKLLMKALITKEKGKVNV